MGISAPAWPFSDATAAAQTAAFQRGLDGLRRLGFGVRVADHVRRRDGSDTPVQERAADLNALFADAEVDAIICAAGGWNAGAVLPLLNWEVIARCPKIVMGYSANTALLNGLAARAGLVTFHGPMVLDGFSEVPDLLPYTREQLERVLGAAAPIRVLRPPPEWTTDVPHGDRPRALRPNAGWRWLRGGRGQGPLVGGNLGALLSLAGTAYWPRCRGAILFVEEVKLGRLSPLPAIDQGLTQLEMLGVLDEIVGLIVGKGNDLSPAEDRQLEVVLSAHTARATFPVLTQVDLGHTDPRLILPIGVRATLDATLDLFHLDEPAVSARQ